MTFSVLGRDPSTGELGIAIATYSLAVGATCPQIDPRLGVLTTQSSTNPSIGEKVIARLKSGDRPSDALRLVVESDPYPEYRQIALLTYDGEAIVHNGSNTKPFTGSVLGENCVAIGNFLSNENVLGSMVTGFEQCQEEATLADRLITTLEAGKSAGGQAGPDGKPLTERSACLIVAKAEELFPIDLRIDLSMDAIPALRRAYNAYHPMHCYYLTRAHNPVDLPFQDEWMKRSESV